MARSNNTLLHYLNNQSFDFRFFKMGIPVRANIDGMGFWKKRDMMVVSPLWGKGVWGLKNIKEGRKKVMQIRGKTKVGELKRG